MHILGHNNHKVFFYRYLYSLEGPLLSEAYLKTGHTLYKIMFIVLIFCFFCTHTLSGSSDKDLLITSTLALPLKLGKISFHFFMIIGPLLIFAMSCFQQIYYRHFILLGLIIQKKKFKVSLSLQNLPIH